MNIQRLGNQSLLTHVVMEQHDTGVMVLKLSSPFYSLDYSVCGSCDEEGRVSTFVHIWLDDGKGVYIDVETVLIEDFFCRDYAVFETKWCYGAEVVFIPSGHVRNSTVLE